LPDHLTIEQIIEIFCDDRVDEVKYSENMVGFLKKKTRHLSGGELRLVEVTLAIYSGAKYILIDEPFTGVSPIERARIKAILSESLSAKGLIIADHDYNSVLEIATKIVLLTEGQTREIKNKEELIRFQYLPKHTE
jgi:ABC-type lipopolysaccharide export system ATPase subunit